MVDSVLLSNDLSVPVDLELRVIVPLDVVLCLAQDSFHSKEDE